MPLNMGIFVYKNRSRKPKSLAVSQDISYKWYVSSPTAYAL